MHAILGKPRRALLVCCCALAMSPAAAFDEAQLYINNAPPYSYVDEGREAGLVYDLLDQMAARAGSAATSVRCPSSVSPCSSACSRAPWLPSGASLKWSYRT